MYFVNGQSLNLGMFDSPFLKNPKCLIFRKFCIDVMMKHIIFVFSGAVFEFYLTGTLHLNKKNICVKKMFKKIVLPKIT